MALPKAHDRAGDSPRALPDRRQLMGAEENLEADGKDLISVWQTRSTNERAG